MEVKGHSVRNAPAPRAVVLAGWLADGALFGMLGPCAAADLLMQASREAGFWVSAGVLRALGGAPWAPLAILTMAFILGAWVPRALIVRVLGFSRTPGDRIFGIGVSRDLPVLREHRTPLAFGLIAVGLAASSAGAVVRLVSSPALEAHPALRATEVEPIEAFDPFSGPAREPHWTLASFFYVGGAWPSQYEGRPVMHGFPYEKGPPARFPGKFLAYWGPALPRVTIEGPKTPDRGFGPTAAELRACFEKPISIPETLRDPAQATCLGHRTQTLARHLGELRSQLAGGDGSIEWRLTWFESTSGPDEGTDSPPRGLHLSARGTDTLTGTARVIDRFIFVTPDRTHQTIALERLPTDERAIRTLRKVVGSSRLLRSIDSSRAISSYRLSEVRLAGLLGKTELNPDPVKFAELQTLLLSKISSEPGSLDAYFHLAGTGMLMLRRQKAAVAAGATAGLGTEWAPTLKQLIQSSWRYAQDLRAATVGREVASENPRFEQLQNLWLESRKY